MNKPFWVEFGLFGVKSRSAALAWLCFSIVSTIFMPFSLFSVMTMILRDSPSRAIVVGLLCGVFGVFSCLWYWFCIRWMDANRGWTK